ncbi:serine--tRNA ligase, partial [Patescibacteria group bacterium]|nr:serine--tRNA ligase [Patescibacteria group bacterium]
MLDPNYIREYPEEVKENIRNRGLTGPQFDVADFLQVDEKRRSLMTEIQGLRALKNKLSDSNGQPASQAIQEAKKTKEQIKALECDLEELTKKWQWYLDWFPNMAHASMPIGKDASGNVELKVSGEKKTFSFEPKHHITLGEELDLIDTKKSAETSGSRWYFLKNEAVLLQRALFNLAVDKLTQQGFTLMIPPVVLKYRPLYGTGYFPSEES